MKVKLLNDFAKAPTRGSTQAAGFDLYSTTSSIIKPGKRLAVKTGIAATAPEGCYLRIAPRSGLAYNHGIMVNGGVVDADYTGEIMAILHNTSDVDFEFLAGDKIAQIIPEKIQHCNIELVSELTATNRADGKMGSTGR